MSGDAPGCYCCRVLGIMKAVFKVRVSARRDKARFLVADTSGKRRQAKNAGGA
ncbi:MAG: hypothetical protein ACK5JT_09480 [Hyphomicrobiaceae bacterium]